MNNVFARLRIVVICLLLVIGLTEVSKARVHQQADQLLVSKEVTKIKQGIELLEKELVEQGENAKTLWLLAKGHLYWGDRSLEEEKLAIFEAGQKLAEKAVELDPNSPDAFYWQAALMGRVGQTRGVMQSLFMVKPMRDALERVLELQADYADAYYVLSQLYQEAPGFPISIGNRGLALENAEKAIELDSTNPDYQIQLAKALEHNKRKEEAVQVLEELLAGRAINQDPEIKAEAEALLAKWK